MEYLSFEKELMFMGNVIKDILEIDEKARQMITDAERKKDRIIREAQDSESAIKNEVITKANNRIEKIEEIEKSNCDKKLSELNKIRDDKVSALNSIYENEHKNWEDSIFNSIVK